VAKHNSSGNFIPPRGLSIYILELLLNNEALCCFDINQAIRDCSGGDIIFNLHSIYPTIEVLEKEQYITMKYCKSRLGGPDRKYFSISQKGFDYYTTYIPQQATNK
jgi:DNA-binding PadR family transcriptional regulator